MLFNLVRKDLILTKKYLIIMLIITIAAPIFIQSRNNLNDGGFLSFFLSTFMVQYMLFNVVSMSEAKYKGSALLCATPYTRNALVKAEYLFLFVIFVSCYMIYTMTAFLAPININMKMLSVSVIGITLLITTIFFGTILPVQYQFGYEKTTFIFRIIFMIPFFVLPAMINFLKSTNISFQRIPSFPPIIQALSPSFLALVIGFVSMIMSIHIYSKKNL